MKASLKPNIHCYFLPSPHRRHFITKGTFVSQAKLDLMNLGPFPSAFLPYYIFGVASRSCISCTSTGFEIRLTVTCSPPQRQAQHWPSPQGLLLVTVVIPSWICPSLRAWGESHPAVQICTSNLPEQSLMLAARLHPKLLGHTLSSGAGRGEHTSVFPHLSCHLVVSLTFRLTVLTLGCLIWEHHTWCCLVNLTDPQGWEKETQGHEASSLGERKSLGAEQLPQQPWQLAADLKQASGKSAEPWAAQRHWRGRAGTHLTV